MLRIVNNNNNNNNTGNNIATDLLKALSYGSPLLGKHVTTNAQPTTGGHPLLDNGPVNIFRGNEYATIKEAVFSVVRAVLAARH
jgi:hypothetical protein